MITKKIISILELLVWSRRDLVIFFFISAVPVVFYKFLGFEFLHLPENRIVEEEGTKYLRRIEENDLESPSKYESNKIL
jgi:hypothetical protein